jgi:hypothetical protein
MSILPFACNSDLFPIDLQGWFIHNMNSTLKWTMSGVIFEHIGLEKGKIKLLNQQ